LSTAAASASRAFWAGTLGYLASCLLFGLNLPLSAELLKHFDPFWVSPLRYLVSAVMLAGMVLVSVGPRQLRSPIPLWRVAVLSLCVAAFLVLYNLGLYRSGPLTVAAITPDGMQVAFSLRGGEILVVLGICSWTAYSILAQRWFEPGTPQLRRTFLTTVGALPWLLLFWAGARAIDLVGPPNLSPAPVQVAQLLVAAVFCTGLATVAWNIGVNRLGIQSGGLWQNTVPVFAVLIALLFFGVQPLAEQLIGGAVVLAGVLYMQWQRLRTTRQAA
jgi:drug/metabolite transporter (DMT)-like permease